MYEKVSTNLNFVDREKMLRNSGKKITSLKRVWKTVKKVKLTPFMTDRQQLTANRISDMF